MIHVPLMVARHASPQDNFTSAKGDFKDLIASEISDSMLLLSLPIFLLSGAIALRITMIGCLGGSAG